MSYFENKNRQTSLINFSTAAFGGSQKIHPDFFLESIPLRAWIWLGVIQQGNLCQNKTWKLIQNDKVTGIAS